MEKKVLVPTRRFLSQVRSSRFSWKLKREAPLYLIYRRPFLDSQRPITDPLPRLSAWTILVANSFAYATCFPTLLLYCTYNIYIRLTTLALAVLCCALQAVSLCLCNLCCPDSRFSSSSLQLSIDLRDRNLDLTFQVSFIRFITFPSFFHPLVFTRGQLSIDVRD